MIAHDSGSISSQRFKCTSCIQQMQHPELPAPMLSANTRAPLALVDQS